MPNSSEANPIPTAAHSARFGMGGHQSARSDSEVWLTPPHVLAALGQFDLDPCACMMPRPWPTADTHITREEDGLTKPWHGRVWLNPPYGPPAVVTPWMRRMVAHGIGTALIFARTDTAMFHDYVFAAASAVLFLRGRLFFCRSDGVPAAANAGAPSVLVAYGQDDADRLRLCGLPGSYHAITAPSFLHPKQLELVA